MTAFADILDLRTAVVEHVRRSDFVDVFPRLVTLAEVGFNRRLRCHDQVTSEPVVIASGAGSLSCGLLEIIGVYDGAGAEYVAQPLQALQQTQRAGYYAVAGNEILTKNDATLTVQYYAAIPSLAGATATTNWLLRKAPALYLYGVAVEAGKYLRDVDVVQATMPFLEKEYQAIAAFDAGQRFARARVRVAGCTP